MRHRGLKVGRLVNLSFGLLAAGAALPGAAAAAAANVVVDFERLQAGAVVSEASSGAAVAGERIAGSIAVFGQSRDGAVSSNAGVVFDATCGGSPAGCMPDEPDKFKPELGNVLTVNENVRDRNGDGLVDSPNPAADGGVVRLDFSGFGPGKATVLSFDVLDLDHSGGFVEVHAGGKLVKRQSIPHTGNNGLATVDIGAPGTEMAISFPDSFGLDNIRLQVERPATPPAAPVVAGFRCTIWGGANADHLRGTPRNDVICTFGGNDSVRARGGGDRVFGGLGADRLVGGGGNDRLLGQGGRDVVAGGAGRDTIHGGVASDVLSGARGADTLAGSGGNDTLVGGAGGDVMRGMRGADALYARDGVRDLVNGGSGTDRARTDGLDRLFSSERRF